MMTFNKKIIVLFLQFQNILECLAGKYFIVLVFQIFGFCKIKPKHPDLISNKKSNQLCR